MAASRERGLERKRRGGDLSSDDPPASTPALALFPGGTYPSQLADGPAGGFHGEYRGFFPREGGVWDPSGSYFGGRGKGHGGLDIYAPYAPPPLETPILAIADGTLNCRYGHLQPNALGNRAEIKAPGAKEVFSYGHLSRFEGRSRKEVKRGEIIGYAGCTGNADTEGECSVGGSCNINAGHLHLSVRNEKDVTVDPLKHVELKLRFGAGEALAKTRPCSEWVDTASGPGPKTRWHSSPPDEQLTRLSGRSEVSWRRANGRRVPLPPPFALLEFDATAELKASRAFYELCRSRFEKLRALSPPARQESLLSADEKTFKAFLETRAEAAATAIASSARDALKGIRDRVVNEQQAVIGLGSADPAARVPGWLMRHISALEQMLWVVCGGPSLDLMASNVAGTEGKDRYKAHPLLADKGSFASLRCLEVIECGAGVGGSAWLSAADGGRGALHLTSLRTGEGDQARDYRVFSVTFGAGSLMHATVSERMAEPALGGTAEAPPVEAAIAKYLDLLFVAFAAIVDIHWLALRHQVHLSSEAVGAAAGQRRIEILRDVERAIGRALDALAACPAFLETGDGQVVPQPLLRRLAAANVTLFDGLIARSQQKEGDRPVGPGLHMLKAVTPNEN